MIHFTRWTARQRESVGLAIHALRGWGPRQILTATAATIAFGVLLGVATVLIPNSLFSRDIPTVWWNYPVWIATSVMTGALIATYVRPRVPVNDDVGPGEASAAARRTEAAAAAGASVEKAERRSGRFAMAGGVLAWFAVGCPVCNKIALIALGYSGALTWFAPAQPFLAAAALILSTVAVVWRLRGQVVCAMPTTREVVTV